jgi:hypothetical protein
MAIFPEDRAVPVMDCDIVQIRLSELQLYRPPAMGCLLADLSTVGSVATG